MDENTAANHSVDFTGKQFSIGKLPTILNWKQPQHWYCMTTWASQARYCNAAVLTLETGEEVILCALGDRGLFHVKGNTEGQLVEKNQRKCYGVCVTPDQKMVIATSKTDVYMYDVVVQGDAFDLQLDKKVDIHGSTWLRGISCSNKGDTFAFVNTDWTCGFVAIHSVQTGEFLHSFKMGPLGFREPLNVVWNSKNTALYVTDRATSGVMKLRISDEKTMWNRPLGNHIVSMTRVQNQLLVLSLMSEVEKSVDQLYLHLLSCRSGHVEETAFIQGLGNCYATDNLRNGSVMLVSGLPSDAKQNAKSNERKQIPQPGIKPEPSTMDTDS